MKAWIHGYSGRMGREIIKQMTAESQGVAAFVGGSSARGLYYQEQEGLPWARFGNLLSEAEVLIDFSSVEGNRELLEKMQAEKNARAAILIGSTGLSEETIAAWQKLAKERGIAVLLAPNTSLGILLLQQVSKLLGKVLSPLNFDIEILESHHRNKLDAPSGTGNFLAKELAKTLGKTVVAQREGKRRPEEIGVTSLRGGAVFGEHEIQYLGDEEEIRLSHRALSRSLFAKGAVQLARWVRIQKPGFYRLEDIGIEEMIQLIKDELGD